MEATMTSTSGATSTQGTELTSFDGARSPSVPAPAPRAPHILLYSDDVTVREQVRLAVGRRVRAGAPDIVWKEVATAAAVVAAADKGGLDLLVLDGEADKAGGMGLCRQLKNEIFRCPPVLVLTGRPQDGWLASWSLADEAVPRPFDAIELQRAIVSLIE
jgi:DNA-binding response OmpR family regulator